jgi:hypothetical protein
VFGPPPPPTDLPPLRVAPDDPQPPNDLAPPIEPAASEPAEPVPLPDLGQCVDLQRPPPLPPPRHVELRLSTLPVRSEAGQQIVRCMRDAFDPLLRFVRSTIELRLTADHYLVARSSLPAERCRQLESCLAEHRSKLQNAPATIDIRIVESSSP